MHSFKILQCNTRNFNVGSGYVQSQNYSYLGKTKLPTMKKAFIFVYYFRVNAVTAVRMQQGWLINQLQQEIVHDKDIES